MNQERAITIELSLPSQLGYEKLVRQTIGWLAPHFKLAAARIADLQTAASEACINAIEHGNRLLDHLRLDVTFRLTETYVEVVVVDEGVARFQPPAEPVPTIEAKLAGLAPTRCMGLMLIEQLVDEAEFQPAGADQGNRVRLRMYRAG